MVNWFRKHRINFIVGVIIALALSVKAGADYNGPYGPIDTTSIGCTGAVNCLKTSTTVSATGAINTGQYNSTLPTLTSAAYAPISLDINGRALVNTPGAGQYNTSEPTYTTGQFVPLSTDVNGNMFTNIFGWNHTKLDGAAGLGTYPANALAVGMQAATTTNPTNTAAGNIVGIMGDEMGKVVNAPIAPRGLIALQQTTISATGETTIVTAGAAGVFRDIICLTITTAGAAAQTITIKDSTGGTTRAILDYPNAALAPGAPLVWCPPAPLPQATAANNWTATDSLATATHFTVEYVNNT